MSILTSVCKLHNTNTMYCLANGTSYINNKSIGMIDMIRQRPCQNQSASPLPPHQHHTPATISLSLTHKVSMLQGMRVVFHNVPVQKTSLSVEELGAYQPVHNLYTCHQPPPSKHVKYNDNTLNRNFY